MHRFQWLTSFIIIALLISSCGTTDVRVSVDQLPVQPLNIQPASPTQTVSTPETIENAEPNECLQCHSDKQRLIETGDPVEPTAESESKGVG
jgi:uncharacterized lipoprotein YmbA